MAGKLRKADIGANNASESKLRESGEIYQRLIDNTSDYITLIDLAGRYVYASPSHVNMGYKPKELVGKSAINQVHPEDRARLLPLLAKFAKKIITANSRNMPKIKKEAGALRLNFRFPTKSGEWHYLESAPSIVEGPAGRYNILLVSRDVTERRLTQEKLKESEARLSEAQRIAHIGNWNWNTKTNEMYWSEENYRIFRIPRNVKPSYAAFMRYVHPDDRKAVNKAVDDALHKRKPYDIDMRIIRPDGTEGVVNARAVVVFDAAGKPERMTGTVHDITERKKLEEKLRNDAQFTASIIKGLKDGFAVLDKTGKQIMVNDEFCRMTGYSEEELLSQKPPFKYWAEEGRKDIEAAFRKTIRGIEGEYELIFRRKNGERFLALVCPRKTTDADGNIVFFASVEDITERKRAHDELLKFKFGLERSSDAVFITDIDGHILYVNPAFEKIYGFSKGEALGKTPRIIKSGLLPPEAYKQFWDTMLAKKVVAGEITNRKKDGTVVNIEGSNNPILDGSGEIAGFLAIHRDITERKKAEEELKKLNQDLKSKVDELERFRRLTVGRELKMIEMKKRICELESREKKCGCSDL